MKKRVWIFGLLLCCMLGLSACGQSQDPGAAAKEAEKEEQYRQMGLQNGEQLLSELAQVHEEGMIDDLLGQDDNLDKLLNNYVSGMEDVGYISEIGESVCKVDGNQIIVDTDIVGTLTDSDGNPRTAYVEMIFDAKGTKMYPDLSVNPKYTNSELMTKAGLNTLLGMGVTFTILILISLIISSFTLIAKIQNKPKEKAETPAATSVDNAVRQIVAGEEQQETDDTELIAVLAAAIAAYESENGGYVSPDGVVIRSVRKVSRARRNYV
ncbi:MAG: OadG family protein [Lachnospiraceae bacterium]|nr:OadG family protein [Lachnospiraceae bacterium]